MCLLQNEGGGSFPLTIEIEVKKGGLMGMRPKNNLAMTQCATKWSYGSFKFESIVIWSLKLKFGEFYLETFNCY